MSVQYNVDMTVNEIRTALRRSVANGTRVWLGNQAGRDACVAAKRPIEDDA